MDCLSVRKQNHPEVPIPGFLNPNPLSDPSISLHVLVVWAFYGPQNPFVLDPDSVGFAGPELSGARLNDEMDSSRVFTGIAMCQHSGVIR